jgi:hypothetical protein
VSSRSLIALVYFHGEVTPPCLATYSTPTPEQQNVLLVNIHETERLSDELVIKANLRRTEAFAGFVTLKTKWRCK